MAVATESMSGLYELRDCKFNELPLSVLEWMVAKMGLEAPEKPIATGKRRTPQKVYKRTLERMVEEAFKSAYCFYLRGDRHYWVINGLVWYYSALNQFNLKGSCQDWNRGKYGKFFQIPERCHKLETIWIIMAEDLTDDVPPLYYLETMTTDRDYCDLLLQEATTYPSSEGKHLSVVEALPEHLQAIKPMLSLEAEEALKAMGYDLIAYEPDRRQFLVKATGKGYAVYQEEPLEVLNATWYSTPNSAIAATDSSDWDYWNRY